MCNISGSQQVTIQNLEAALRHAHLKHPTQCRGLTEIVDKRARMDRPKKKVGVLISGTGVSQSSVLQAQVLVTPQPLGLSGYCFHPWCPGCISETVRCRKLILGRDVG